MPSLINPRKREIPILPRLTILHTPNTERRITSLRKLRTMLILCGQRNGLPAKPVTDVIGVAVDKRDSDGAGEDIF